MAEERTGADPAGGTRRGAPSGLAALHCVRLGGTVPRPAALLLVVRLPPPIKSVLCCAQVAPFVLSLLVGRAGGGHKKTQQRFQCAAL